MFALSQLSTVLVFSVGNLVLANKPASQPPWTPFYIGAAPWLPEAILHVFACVCGWGIHTVFWTKSLYGNHKTFYYSHPLPKSQAFKPPLDLSEKLHEDENIMCLPWGTRQSHASDNHPSVLSSGRRHEASAREISKKNLKECWPNLPKGMNCQPNVDNSKFAEIKFQKEIFQKKNVKSDDSKTS